MQVKELIEILKRTKQDAHVQLVCGLNRVILRAKYVEIGKTYHREFNEDLVAFRYDNANATTFSCAIDITKKEEKTNNKKESLKWCSKCIKNKKCKKKDERNKLFGDYFSNCKLYVEAQQSMADNKGE